MIILLDTPQDLSECESDLDCDVGQLLAPGTQRKLFDPSRPWAIDNGAYTTLDTPVFEALLKREWHRRADCLFVTVPDIVGCARRTAEVFDLWAPRLAGWPLALAIQDGIEHVPIPWERIDAVFIGGSTPFKCGLHAERAIRAAKLFGKWVHVGRVNTPARFEHFRKLGADSVDGTGLARYSHMRDAIANRHDQLDLMS